MFQRGTTDPFFNMKALAPRPLSTSTDIYDDTEFEDGSDMEEDYSPRISLNSVSYHVVPPTCHPPTNNASPGWTEERNHSLI
jgi:hypothetical protein